MLYCTHSHINLLILLVTCSSHDKVATGARVGSINVQRRLLPHPLSPSHGVSHLTRACCATGNTTGGVQRKHLARFVGHESHPEGSTVLPGATLTKTWIVRNDARVPWPPGNVQVSCPSSLGCKCQAAGDGLSLEFPRLPKPHCASRAGGRAVELRPLRITLVRNVHSFRRPSSLIWCLWCHPSSYFHSFASSSHLTQLRQMG